MHQTTIRKTTKRFFSGSIATLFLMLQLPLMLLASPSVGATHIENDTNPVTNTNSEQHYENDETGECEKYERNEIGSTPNFSSDGKTFTVPVDSTKDYTLAVVKAGSETGGSVENENEFYNEVEGGDPLTHGSGKQISHVILCFKPATTTGTLTIKKVTSEATETEFGFSSSVEGSSTFSLSDGETKALSNLQFGTEVAVRENLDELDEDWELTDIACTIDGTSTTTGNVNLDTGTAAVTLSSTNNNVTCTFTNTQDTSDTGLVVVDKELDNTGDGTYTSITGSEAAALGFNWTLDAETTPRQFGTQVTTSVGNHTVDETMNSADYKYTGWYFTASSGKSCTNPNGTDRPVNVVVAKDTTTRITLCNQKIVPEATGSITIVKEANPETGEPFSFSGNLNPTPFVLSDNGEDGTTETETFDGLDLEGVFTVTESASTFPGWTLKDIKCTTGGTKNINERTAVIEFSNEVKNVTCTFFNVKETPEEVKGSITIVKRTNFSTTTQMFDFTSNLEGSFNFQLSGNNATNNSVTKSNLDISKTYTVTEAAHEGWTLDSVVCTTGGVANKTTATVTVNLTDAHKDVTCTFTNKANGGIGGEPVQPVAIVTPVTPTTPQAPVLNLFVPAKAGVGGASTTNPGQLVDTGSTMLLNVFAGLFVLGMVAALTATNRRQYS